MRSKSPFRKQRRRGRSSHDAPIGVKGAVLVVLLVLFVLISLGGQESERRARNAGPDPASGSDVEPGKAADLIGRVTHVRDGDTIEVAGVPIRIANLDCAETGTAAGERATAKVRDLVRDQTMSCMLEGRKSWDREVGVCALATGDDLGEAMISGGYCGRWPGY
ncbi:hypothetical protein RM543_07565 [Roseicyclus sp. F158]|uniref:TNase-like domain-containing protein n=1 Tax=Tropicimonas omnivorans TaxID=3075590 RepID=A0ABU3DFP4_9RHOB|nr:hypothetical protein [Roseicyclus sp. F158]MDT0682537.1 hypothetical protein [Roseicyclus sp. F158]